MEGDISFLVALVVVGWAALTGEVLGGTTLSFFFAGDLLVGTTSSLFFAGDPLGGTTLSFFFTGDPVRFGGLSFCDTTNKTIVLVLKLDLNMGTKTYFVFCMGKLLLSERSAHVKYLKNNMVFTFGRNFLLFWIRKTKSRSTSDSELLSELLSELRLSGLL